jgi:hypothetical protein
LIELINTKYFKQLLLLSIFLISSVYINPVLFSSKQALDPSLPNYYNDTEIGYDTFNTPKLSIFGEAPWWDSSFEYRRLVNITNPYALNFTNFGVSFSFNYDELVQAGKMQSDLDDIRIVENGVLRNYYVVKDYPSLNYAIVFFDTDISQNTFEIDTYMYFGNTGAVNAESKDPNDSFGWVKNGNFELDIDTNNNFVPYGWTFSHNPVDEINGIANPSPNPHNSTSYELFVNKLIDEPEGGERVAEGSYTYKFGDLNHLANGAVNDYAGTLFSYPFTVPIVEGGEITLSFFRNIRTYCFERPKNMGAINKDGYFIRILNGSSTIYDSNPDNHSDSDISPTYENYVEAYDGYAYYNVPAKSWKDETLLIDFPGHVTTIDTLGDSADDGELTGYTEFDLTGYMGKEIFFEIGVWGDESEKSEKKKSAFFQIDDLGFNYTLTASVHEVQARKSELTITARDVDGRIVPNAEIFVLNESAKGTPSYIVDSGYTSVFNGSISFSGLLNGEYNITANYTLDSREEIVGNMVKILNGTSYNFDLTLNLWTIDFEVTDWEGIPLNYGYIEINESDGGAFLDILTLDNDGKATFRWLNTPDYYFRVFYENDDYSESPFLLNESYITRAEYESVKSKTHALLVDDTNLAPSSEERYFVEEIVYTDGSKTDFGNKEIIKANITLTGMNNQLTNVSIYYIDKYNSTGTGDENLIYFEEGYGFNEDNDFIEIDIPKVENLKLESEKFEVYGLYVVVNGANDTTCNGLITIDLLETCNVLNKTHLSRLNIRVININELSPEGAPVDAVVKVFDNQTGEAITNLISDSGRDGYAYGQMNDIPFWFFKDRIYNFSIDIVNITNADFNVTLLSPDNQWSPTDNNGVQSYNYTLYGQASITFNIIFKQEINITNYDTAFFNSSGTLEVFWGEDLTYSVIFNYTLDNGITWNAITNPSAICTLYFREIGSEVNLITENMGAGSGPGNFSATINSNRLSAGGTYKLYYVVIEGLYPGYPEPNSVNFIVKVKTIPTDISLHDYDTRVEILDQSISAYYNELVNISVQYFIDETGTPLIGATLTYTWIGLSPINIFTDPLNNLYYTFTINTSDAQSTGLKIVNVIASFENYTTQSNFLIYLNILERKTDLNGQSELVYLNPKVWVQDAHDFMFTYSDANTLETIGDLTIATYIWQELYENGSIIPGRDGSGTLIQYENKTYALDFNTEHQQVGFYYLFVTLQKENYETKSALINLEMVLREFEVEISIENLVGNQVNVIHGNSAIFEINLHDITRGNIQLENATVTLIIGGSEYVFNETSPGTYSFTFETEAIEAFFAPNLLSGTIRVQKVNFTSQDIRIVVNVQMEEIFPGMPMFYFILITAAIIGIAGSLITYRVIQQARIPKFVKKIRKVKNTIKSKKSISESYAIKTKEHMMLKLFGEDWKALDLSLEDKLGTRDLKLKTIPLKGKKSKKGGDRD